MVVVAVLVDIYMLAVLSILKYVAVEEPITNESVPASAFMENVAEGDEVEIPSLPVLVKLKKERVEVDDPSTVVVER